MRREPRVTNCPLPGVLVQEDADDQAAMLAKQPSVRVTEAFAAWYLAWSIGELLIGSAKQKLRPEFGGWDQYILDREAELMDLPEDVAPS